MAGNILLKVVVVAVFLGLQYAAAQDIIFYNNMPANDPINRRVEVMPQPVAAPGSVRSRNKPMCASANDPTAAEGSAPCIQDQEYNDNVRNLVRQLLTQTPNVNEIVSDPVLRVILNDTLTTFDPVSPSTRFGGFRETPVCGAQEELIFPQRAKTPKDDWVFVVNQPDVKQALRVEKCTGEGRPCNIGASTRDVTTVCRQKYVYRRMLVLGSNNIEPEEVLMPSCCVCYSRRENFDVATRIITNGNDTSGPGSSVAGQPNPPNQPNLPSQPNPGNQPNPVGQPSPGGNLAFPGAGAFQPPNTAALMSGNRGHLVSFSHSPVRRHSFQNVPVFHSRPMRYP